MASIFRSYGEGTGVHKHFICGVGLKADGAAHTELLS